MLNKKLVLGSLVAGAFLLPLTANAGVVSGPCVNCHTMHDSQDGTTMNAGFTGQLLRGDSCLGCHALGATNDAAGIGTGAVPAPSVNPPGAATANAGGYFTDVNTVAGDAQQHNVYLGTAAVLTTDSQHTFTPPGGTAMTAQIECGDCHGGTGGHHGTGDATTAHAEATVAIDSTYRMLWSGGVGVANTTGSATYGNVDASASTMDVTGPNHTINNFCASCHDLFHAAVPFGANQWDAANSVWLRHPTDIDLTDPGNTNIDIAAYTGLPATGANSQAVLPLGVNTTATTTQNLMCTTCHRAHGNSNPDMLRFGYNNGTDNEAGDVGSVQSFGCETCHGVK